MENTNKMGLTLVENYSSAEEGNISTCESILTISVKYVEEREKDFKTRKHNVNSQKASCRGNGHNVTLEELREGLYPLMNGLTDLYGHENIQIYGKAMGGTRMISNASHVCNHGMPGK